MAYVESTSVTGRPSDGPLAVVEINFLHDERFRSVWTLFVDWKHVYAQYEGGSRCNAKKLYYFVLYIELK